jgi:hypothetical protein
MELTIWVESREDGKLVAMSQVAKIERKSFGIGPEELV